MAFWIPFLLCFSSLLAAEGLLARCIGGALCLCMGFFGRFSAGSLPRLCAPLLLGAAFLRMYPLWRVFTQDLGSPRGEILFFLALLVVFLLATNKKCHPPSRLLERTALPFSLVAIGFWGIALTAGITPVEVALGGADLLGAVLCSLSGMLLLPPAEKLPLTYLGIAAGWLPALFLPGMSRGLLLSLLSPLVASAELSMVCSPRAYTENKTTRGKRKGQRHDPTTRNPAGNLEK